jgi:hypothetical protein
MLAAIDYAQLVDGLVAAVEGNLGDVLPLVGALIAFGVVFAWLRRTINLAAAEADRRGY